ncbi:MAG: putative sugar transferase EpsL [Chlamydiae bacterium]|nr:putative sugar transferase EpsL [Chlamydiota bacterium]
MLKIHRSFSKRLFDLTIAFIGTILALPFWVFIPLLIKLTSKGPVFFIDERIGRKGIRFKCYKFRTMHFNAKALLEEYLKHPEYYKEYMKYRKLKNDPRVTHFGKFLRKTSLDELPQLINVLKGDMSIVGPRPYLVNELKEIPKEAFEKIFIFRPGLTCLWQISGRSSLNFEKRKLLDMEYVKKQSFFYDLALFFKTIPTVLFSKGAH